MASTVNRDGESPLYLAAERGSVEAVQMLLGCAMVEYGGPRGQTALHAAVCRSYGNRHEISISIKDQQLCQLHFFKNICRIKSLLTVVRSLDIAKVLLEKMSKLNLETDNSLSAPIHYAASLGDVNMVRLLLQEDATIAHLLDNRGLSALHTAASQD
ncbi:hypothetical protein IEQ34_001880 [Dendrobium chrysotoxum]|uniref:Uncharacterized protein n=1 Tax=Dendrobium chrysotoxum TaxID=161865 RepID=A0AAV7HMC5_DENCH|nr:hypothetical protein IEQ34_001880 [Dendrobium chrysotoxum]